MRDIRNFFSGFTSGWGSKQAQSLDNSQESFDSCSSEPLNHSGELNETEMNGISGAESVNKVGEHGAEGDDNHDQRNDKENGSFDKELDMIIKEWLKRSENATGMKITKEKKEEDNADNVTDRLMGLTLLMQQEKEEIGDNERDREGYKEKESSSEDSTDDDSVTTRESESEETEKKETMGREEEVDMKKIFSMLKDMKEDMRNACKMEEKNYKRVRKLEVSKESDQKLRSEMKDEIESKSQK